MDWNEDIAYLVGLITADGSLSKDGRHIDVTSKDLEQIENVEHILETRNKIGIKTGLKEMQAYRIQFSNVRLYEFLTEIGLTPNKTKYLKRLRIPNKYFGDFLRGYFDGDGSTYSYFDPRWKKSFMLYMSFACSNIEFLIWIREKVFELYKVKGSLKPLSKSGYQLRYAKKGSLVLISKMYYKNNLIHLSRKRSKINEALGIISRNN